MFSLFYISRLSNDVTVLYILYSPNVREKSLHWCVLFLNTYLKGSWFILQVSIFLFLGGGTDKFELKIHVNKVNVRFFKRSKQSAPTDVD